MSFEELIEKIRELSEHGKAIAISLGAMLGVVWLWRDRRNKVTVGQLDITKQAQDVIVNHVSTMAILSESVDRLNNEMQDVKRLERECQERFISLESVHKLCQNQINDLQRKISKMEAQ